MASKGPHYLSVYREQDGIDPELVKEIVQQGATRAQSRS